jgi:hypothetical protein
LKCFFRLTDLGTPEKVASFLIDTRLAPQGSGIVANLIGVSSRQGASGPYYQMEYKVRKEGIFKRHVLAVLAAREGLLYTCVAQCSEDKWEEVGHALVQSVESFMLV